MRLVHLLAAFVLIAAPAFAAAYETRTITVTHDGVTRPALIDAAPGLHDAPAMIVLAGGLASASKVRRVAGVTLAERGWVVIWPDADVEWNDGRTGENGAPLAAQDDVGYFRKLIATLAQDGTIDPRRVFFAGPSIGGGMVLRLICDAPDLVAGAAVALANLPDALGCPDGPPAPLMFFHGSADHVVPFGGGVVGGDSIFLRNRGRVRSAADTLAFFAARNRCDGFTETALPDTNPTDGTTAVRRDYQGCAAPLTQYIGKGAGHNWPGLPVSEKTRFITGRASQDYSATEAIERLFESVAAR
jgi:polyhydroxybutyrate depolymerase